LAYPSRLLQIGPPLVAVGIAALWPLTAYGLNPLLFPALGLLTAVALVALTKPEYGLAVAVALSPLTGLEIYQQLGANVTLPSEPIKVLVPLLVFGVLIYGALTRGVDRRPLPAVFAGIVMLVTAALISTFQALEPSRAVTDVFLLITGASLFLAVLNICHKREQLLVVVGGALIALLIASTQGVVQHFIGDTSGGGFAASAAEETVGRVQGSFGHPNEYAGFLAVLIPFALAVAFTRELPRGLRLLAGVAAAVAVPAIIYSYARGAMAALVIGALFWLLILRPKLAVVFAVVVGVGVLAFAPSTLKERFQADSTEGDVALRADVAQTALDIYAEHPLWGVGVDNFQVAYAERSATESASQRRLFHNEQVLIPPAAPSQYLNTLTEQGLIGVTALAVFLVLALGTAYRASRGRDPAVKGLGLGIGMALATLAVYSLLEISFQEVVVLVVFTLLAVAATAESAFGSARTERAPRGELAPGRGRVEGAGAG